MSREAWGDPPEREPELCPLCGGTSHLDGCELGTMQQRALAAEAELRRLLREGSEPKATTEGRGAEPAEPGHEVARPKESESRHEESTQASALQAAIPAQQPAEPLVWIEAEPAAKGMDLRTVAKGLLLSTCWHWQAERPTPMQPDNVLFPLYASTAHPAAPQPASAQVAEPVAWQYRAMDGADWGPWEELKPRVFGSFEATMAERVAEIEGYIASGFNYQLRALYASPAAQPATSQQTGEKP